MKLILTLLVFWLSVLCGYAQGNMVFSGGELINYSIINIPAAADARWSTDRSAIPGYFSAVDTADYTGCSDAVHIDGYVKKYGNRSFVFPIGGDNKLRTLEISAPSLASDAYAAAWIPGNPSDNLDPTGPFAGTHPVTSTAIPVYEVSTVGQWDWQTGANGNLGTGTTGTGEGLIIKVSIPDMTAFSSTAGLRLVGWDGSSWVDLSGYATATGNTANSILQGTMITNISAIGIGKLVSTLPVRLESFSGIAAGCTASLSWKTSGEFNADRFVIEQSTDGVHYQAVATVLASGLLNGNQYRHVVAQSISITSYRLRMVDKDGAFAFSPVVVVRTDCEQQEYMQVYPNPVYNVTPLVNLVFTTTYRGRAQFVIFSGTSQRLFSKVIQVTSGKNLVSADVTALAGGTYFIRVIGADGRPIGNGQKFIKQ